MKWKVISVLFLLSLIAAAYMLSKEKTQDTAGDKQEESISIVNIQITPTGFVPKDISVKKNTLAVFINTDNKEHELDITSQKDLSFLVSSTLQTGESSSFLFSESGEWKAYTGARASETSIFVA